MPLPRSSPDAMDLVLSPFFPLTDRDDALNASSQYSYGVDSISIEPKPSSIPSSQTSQPTILRPDLGISLAISTRAVQTTQHREEMVRASSTTTSLALSLLFAVLLRASFGLGPYSGFNHPPRFGDFEAQRHWMEITLNLPISEWYAGKHVDNDLEYWGLDYPPLTAYHSKACGLLLNITQPATVALRTSRGEESPTTKAWMRGLALVSDLLSFIPAAAWFYLEDSRLGVLALTSPPLVAIDHGHFQFNCIAHGLTIAAVGLLEPPAPPRVGPTSPKRRIRSEPTLLAAFSASVLFSLALNFKQMTLYFAPAFFFFLLRWSWRGQVWSQRLLRLSVCGLGVFLVFGLCWVPLFLNGGITTVGHALHRIFPVGRGLFEDKVANFWCTLDVVAKVRKRFSSFTLVFLATVFTLFGFIPSLVAMAIRPLPSVFRSKAASLASSPFSGDIVFDDLRWTMFVISISFFLFSYHVHEKSILLPCVASLLLLDEEPLPMAAFQLLAVYSMTPLLVQDGVFLSTLASSVLFCLWVGFNHEARLGELVHSFSAKILALFASPAILLTLCVAVPLPPPFPGIWPDLWVVLLEAHAFCGFLVFHLWASYSHLQRAQFSRNVAGNREKMD